jgi:hypothetical protein
MDVLLVLDAAIPRGGHSVFLWRLSPETSKNGAVPVVR